MKTFLEYKTINRNGIEWRVLKWNENGEYYKIRKPYSEWTASDLSIEQEYLNGI